MVPSFHFLAHFLSILPEVYPRYLPVASGEYLTFSQGECLTNLMLPRPLAAARAASLRRPLLLNWHALMPAVGN